MAITKSAKKAIRSSQRKRVFNLRRKATLHDTVHAYKKHIAQGQIKEAQAMLPTVYKAIDKAAKRNIITKNTANRKKARLTKHLASK